MEATLTDATVQRDAVALKRALADLVADYSIETTPGSAAKIVNFRECLSQDKSVAVTFLPGSNFSDTVATARRLKREGLRPMPHICARAISGVRELEEYLKRLRDDAGAEDVVVLAGGISKPVGTFDSSMQLLQTGLFEKYGMRSIGLAGHPEGSPDISDVELERALHWKNAYAESSSASFYLCTQFAFEADPIISWDRRIRTAGNRLPIHLGVPGLATLKTLIAHAAACGVGPSMRVLTKHSKNMSKLLTTRTPDKFLLDIANYKLSDPSCGIRRVHVYPFGGFRRSAMWFQAVADASITLDPRGEGFEVSIRTE